MRNGTRLLSLLFALVLVAAACGEAAQEGGGLIPETSLPPSDEPRKIVTTESPTGTLPTGPSALRDRGDPGFPEPLVDPGLIISGGPPPDGIPPIEDPQFVGIDVANGWLDDRESVVVLEIEGDARAYPAQVLIWHEIVNDTVGGVPVSITYCPLCNSAVTYRRVVRGVETTFGTSGRLYASALVMYDRATESLWTHFDGRAVIGLLTGDQLEAIPSPLMAWGDFKASYPEGVVLDRERTGHRRQYGLNPYAGYDDPDTFPFLYLGDPDTRARAKQRVVGVVLNGDARAYTLDAVSGGEARASRDEVGGQPIVILWKAGQSTALEHISIAAGRDVGSIGVFDPGVGDRVLTFHAEGDHFVDAETKSAWNIAGVAVSGPLTGSSLERITHLDTFWFAWATYRPDTELVESLQRVPSEAS